MENASKALIIAGSVLISLLVIAALVFMFNQLSDLRQTQEDASIEDKLQGFYANLDTYIEGNKRGNDILSLANLITDFNNRRAGGNESKYGNEGYEPIELNHTIPVEEKEKHMEKWYGDCMDLYYQYKLTQEKLEQSIKQSNLIFRQGAKEILQKCHKENIPVIILSAGIGNVIEQFLKANNCYTDNMYITSNFIEFKSDGSMKKFDHSKMIHTLNKTMSGHLPKEIQQKIQDKEYAILMGDMVEDEKMIEESKWEKTIKIGFLNKKLEENLPIYLKHFDIVLTKEDATFEIIDNIVF